MADTDTKEELDAVAKLGDAIADGESKRGGYNAYNTGTVKGRDGKQRVVYSGVKDLSKMTVDQILESAAKSPYDRDRVFAAGKYQVIHDTLVLAKQQMPLSGTELFDKDLQEKVFLHYLLPHKRPKIGRYITEGVGTSIEATFEASKEWASIETPAGFRIKSGAVSNGHMSYYEGPANHAKPGSGARVQAALENARAAIAAIRNGDAPSKPAPIPETTEQPKQSDEPAKPQTKRTRVVQPGHLIAASVGRGGANHDADVGAIQEALEAHGHSPGPIDHRVGDKTIAAIESYQRTFLRHPDGLVEVGKTTEKHLLRSSERTPALETKREETTAATNLDPQPTTNPDNASLRELMAKPRLTPEEIHRARELIAAEPEASRPALYRDLQTKVNYANQRDNEATLRGRKVETGHGEMCNLTSLAMCLQYLGVPNPHPEMQYEDALEKVRQDKRLAARTTPAGWGGVAAALGVKQEMLAWAGKHPRAWWTSAVGGALSAGHSVMLSITGHIVRVQAVTDDGVVVDDPYGVHRLLPGAGKKIEAYNSKDATGRAGEDNTWPWAQVEPHSFLWIAAFSR